MLQILHGVMERFDIYLAAHNISENLLEYPGLKLRETRSGLKNYDEKHHGDFSVQD